MTDKHEDDGKCFGRMVVRSERKYYHLVHHYCNIASPVVWGQNTKVSGEFRTCSIQDTTFNNHLLPFLPFQMNFTLMCCVLRHSARRTTPSDGILRGLCERS